MRVAGRLIVVGVGLGLVCMLESATAATPTPEAPPAPTELREQVEVRLVLLDVVVVDRDGRTAAGLGRDDFEIVLGGKASAADTLDVACHGGAAEPRAVRDPGRREVPASESRRRVVLAFDYMHLTTLARGQVLDQALELVREGGSAGDEIMVAALTGGLRVEQPFTTDVETTVRTLKRMQHDISLWNGHFGHLSERGWLRSMDALLDVLGTIEGRKAIVLYSGMEDVPLHSQFARIAAAAASARCSIYPVDARGLVAPSSGGPVASSPFTGAAPAG